MVDTQLILIYSLFALILSFFEIRKLRYESTHDQLTGLLNRKRFEELLVDRMEIIKKNKQYILFYFMIDLDNFKKINDIKGHDEGDIILKSVSKALSNSIRSGPKKKYKRSIKSRLKNDNILLKDIICRWGGEEFAIGMIVHVDSICEYSTIESSIEARIGNRLNKIAAENGCTVSIGISAFNFAMEVNVEKLTKRADSAMYQSKNTGKNKTTIFTKRLPRKFFEKRKRNWSF